MNDTLSTGIFAITVVLLALSCSTEARAPFDERGAPTSAAPPAPTSPSLGDSKGPANGPACVATALPPPATQITIDPAFASHYRAYDLGQVPGMPAYKYGGIVVARNDPNLLLIGGNANYPEGTVHAVRVIRNECLHIVGFAGTAKEIASAPYIDGGLIHGPNGTLMFAGWPENTLGVIAPSGKEPAKTIDAATLGIKKGIGESLAAIGFVPAGFAGADRFKLLTWEAGDWFDAEVATDSAGLPDIKNVKKVSRLLGGPEGFAYIPKGSPLFPAESMVVSEWSANGVATYDVGPNGNPVVASRKKLLTGLSGAEGAFFDPSTGDFLFSTWNAFTPERVVIVTGFVPVQAPH